MRYHVAAILVGIAMLGVTAGTARAQTGACSSLSILPVPASGPISVSVKIPTGKTRYTLVDANENAVGGIQRSFGAEETDWSPTAEETNAFRSNIGSSNATPLKLKWEGGQSPCLTILSLSVSNPTTTPATSTTPATPTPAPRPPTETQPRITDSDQDPFTQRFDENDCARAGELLRSHIRRQRESQGRGSPDSFTELVFFEGVGLCYSNRDYGVEGDPIHVAVFTDNPELWNGFTATFEPCAAESEAPRIRVTGELPVVTSGTQAGEFQLRGYLPRRCFNTNVDVTVTSLPDPDGQQQTARYNLTQSERYRASFQAGVNFTGLHNHAFGLRPSSEGNRVFDKGPENEGPEYYASMVFYAIPKYLPSLFGGDPYPGRDVVHDNDVFDRLGLLLGVGISDPLGRFVYGASFDLIPGISVVYTREYARVDRLAGIAEGDLFTGNEETIPVRERWDAGSSWGLAIDIRYLTRLFGGTLPGGM